MNKATLLFAFSLFAVGIACGGSEEPSDGASNDTSGTSEDELRRNRCGGFLGLTCPKGKVCVDDPSDSCDPQNGGRDCMGICKKPTAQACGGFAGLPCPAGQECVDDPTDSCDPKNGGADCGGICQPKPAVTNCGGFAGLQCPKGQTCVDDPNDSCDPKNGGADCMGICQ